MEPLLELCNTNLGSLAYLVDILNPALLIIMVNINDNPTFIEVVNDSNGAEFM